MTDNAFEHWITSFGLLGYLYLVTQGVVEVHSDVTKHDPQWIVVRSFCALHYCIELYFNQIAKLKISTSICCRSEHDIDLEKGFIT